MRLIGPALAQLMVQLPIWTALIVGLVIALVTWRRHPRVSLLSSIALTIFLLQTLLGALINVALPQIIASSGLGTSQLSGFLTIYGTGQSLISAVAWGLLLWAMFGARSEGTRL